MSGGTLGSLMNRRRTFEVQLASFYAGVRDRSRDNGVRLLTYYLARHRRHQEEALSAYDRTDIARFRKTRIPENIRFDFSGSFALTNVRPAGVKGGELLNAALGYDRALIGLYRSILKQPLDKNAKAMLKSLIRAEERDVTMLKKMTAMHYY